MKLSAKLLAIFITFMILKTSSIDCINKKVKKNNLKGSDSSLDELTSESEGAPEEKKAEEKKPEEKKADAKSDSKETKVDLSGVEVPKGYELKAKAPNTEQRKEEELHWEQLFGKKRGESCSGKTILKYELQKIGVNENGELVDSGAIGASGRSPLGTGEFGWVKQWGFGLTAYLFDFLDPVLRGLMLKEFEDIWKKFKSYKSEDSEEYKDPFGIDDKVDPKLDAVSQKRQQDHIDKIKKLRQTEIYKNSVNAVQINLGMKENKWHLDKTESNPAKSFIRKYDMNRDGRLSPRELILGSIFHNKAILGDDECTLCYSDLVDKIDGIFAYIDCDDDGLVSSLDMYTHLPKLRRDSNKWNFFELAPQAQIRTAVTNDFVLKNMYAENGLISKPEFRNGILLGFWDRQTDNFGIVTTEAVNMKKLRWKDDDVVDIGAMEYIANKALMDAERKRNELKKQEESRPQGTELEVSFAKEQN